MGFKIRDFGKPVYDEYQEDPKRVIIISCEGSVTEPEYFNTIKVKLAKYLSDIIEIEVVNKQNNASEPQNVMANLQRYVEAYDYRKEHDSLWLVCDREKVDARKKHLKEIMPICKENGYKLAISNPLFELWLLMHITDISQYDKKVLFANEPVNASRKFIDKQLSNILDNGYNKKAGRFNKDIVTYENLIRAIEQEKTLENNEDLLLDNLGSNIGELINDILS
ncbi:RloB family protein [uncultured Vibrio sp.]|uniref:RloB family protein n=1 Tax=uncultured Vibrio sp. TaxID=114054 RepID=UPI0026173453|nr:RloB family protein [uncultured Vibrio sp.]